MSSLRSVSCSSEENDGIEGNQEENKLALNHSDASVLNPISFFLWGDRCHFTWTWHSGR